MSFLETEIASQPSCWKTAKLIASKEAAILPRTGERVALVGCGTSWFMAQAYATMREAAGLGETDAFAASEMPRSRSYDRVIAITRSGMTTEVLDVLDELSQTTETIALTEDPGAPVVEAVKESIVLDFAQERSVVQSRFATTVLMLLRVHLGHSVDMVIADAKRALQHSLSPELLRLEQLTFLGRGWTYGIAQEAALKLREAAGFWTEAYPAMEYRHGPISIAGANRATWIFGTPPLGLIEDTASTGGLIVHSNLDPLAELIRAQRLAVALAEARGLDPDNPRNLRRAVVLEGAARDEERGSETRDKS